VEGLARHLAVHEYEQQRGELDHRLTAQGEDVFVAKLALRQDADGRAFSATTWPKGVDNGLLPVADRVVLVDPDDDEVPELAWEDAMELGASWTRPVPDEQPARVRILGWPEDRLVELKTRAIRVLRR
jgi:hypothetical protein